MNRSPIIAGLAVAAAAVLGSAAMAGAANADGEPGTLGALHASGCVPQFTLDVGEVAIGYGGQGQAACAGQVATLAYDGPAGRAVVIDLGGGTINVVPDCGAVDEQVDVWVGDVREELAAERNGGPRFDSAWRLVTASWLDGAPCAPTTTTPPPVPVNTARCEAGAYARVDFAGPLPTEAVVTVNGLPRPVASSINPWLAVAPFDTPADLASLTEGATVGCWSPPADDTPMTTAPAPVDDTPTSTTSPVVDLANPTPPLTASLPVTGPTAPYRDPVVLGFAALALVGLGGALVKRYS